MACNCIDEINAELTDHEVETGIMLRKTAMTAETYSGLIRKDNGRLETRSKKPRYFAHTFCPFCGTRYRDEAEETAAIEQAVADHRLSNHPSADRSGLTMTVGQPVQLKRPPLAAAFLTETPHG